MLSFHLGSSKSVQFLGASAGFTLAVLYPIPINPAEVTK
jgi:hypothetical protein